MRQHFYEDVSNLNAPYDIVPLQGLGQADDPRYPWKTQSQDTLVLQQDLNEWLTYRKGCLLPEDGVLGPKTCGALAAYGQSISTCVNHAAEAPPVAPTIPCPSSGGGGGSQPVVLEEQTIVGGERVPGWMIGVALGAIAIGAALMLGGKKKRR